MRIPIIPPPRKNELLCSWCGDHASTEAVYRVSSPYGVDEVKKKFCQPHATKFAISFSGGRISFRRLPMPTLSNRKVK